MKTIDHILPHLNLNIGMILDDKYEIKREIARGGMGIVYEAYDTFVHRQVAIKIMIGNKIDSLQLKRFQKEIEACARLSHPNVIKIYDAGMYENNPYIIMEYIDGVNICKYVAQHDKAYGQANDERKKERDWQLCARLIYETALGLDYIHKQKMFHRDIKPSNIIVRSNGSPVIIDFGLVKFNQERSYNLTRSRDIMGTCQYMPIEQAKGKRGTIDERSDVYSLGLVLYELLTEQKAYSGKDITDIFKKIISYYPPLPREINAHIPTVLEKITMHAIEKDKKNRYSNAQEFADALNYYLNGAHESIITQYIYNKKRLGLQRNKKHIVACSIALLILGTIFISFYIEICYKNYFNIKLESIKEETEEQTPITEETKQYSNLLKQKELEKKIQLKEQEEAEKKLAEQQKLIEQQEIAKQYYAQGKFGEAFNLFKEIAEKGNAEAEFTLATMYMEAKGTLKDEYKARLWYEKAANQDFVQAQYNLGNLYYNGKDVQQDLEKAVYWYEKATNQGHQDSKQNLIEAQYKLAGIYHNQKNLEKAIYLYEKVANQEYAEAQYKLADLYYEGEDIQQDFEKAIYWYERAANLGHKESIFMLGRSYFTGHGIKQDLKKARDWFEKGANLGHKGSQLAVGRMYFLGQGGKRDKEKANYWLKKSNSNDND